MLWRRVLAFTLIELLVVIAVIAILAALIFPVTGAVNRIKMRSKARAELAEAASAIEAFKSKLGHYPPDDPGYPYCNQLYFELLGTTNNGNLYITLDSSAQVSAVPSTLQTYFGPGVSGFVNCNRGSAGDEGRAAINFLNGVLKPGQIVEAPGTRVRYLICSIPWPYPTNWLHFNSTANPINYNSSNPTNNPNSYDLWIDIVINHKVTRVSNWSRDPVVVGNIP
jgi:prepilin-type N-terminal cleavage/methylation domain-containing protein